MSSYPTFTSIHRVDGLSTDPRVLGRHNPGKENVVADALNWKSRGGLANIASREWRMLETVEQFGLQYNEHTQGTLGSLVATPSVLSRVIESQGQDTEIVSVRNRV